MFVTDNRNPFIYLEGITVTRWNKIIKMTLLKRLFGELFTKTEDKENDEDSLLLKESIEHTEFFLREYEQWRAAELHIGLLDHLWEQKIIRDSNPNAELNFHQYASQASNGFYFLGEEPWSNKDYSFIIEYFSSILLSEGYRLNNSSREVRESKGVLNTLERYYFKLPLSSRLEKPYEQSWGNIVIHQKLTDERTTFVKVMANIYSDRNYQAPKAFDTLVEKLLTR